MKELMLKNIIKSVSSGCEIDGDLTVKGISTDTREDMEGKVYIALEGERFDGHDFIKQAIDKGAVAVICKHEQNINFENFIYVSDTKKALMDIAKYYRTLFPIKVVGVTGSVGKTTTKDMISAVLSEKYNVLKTKENLNNEIGVSKTILSLEDSHEVLVIEMGMCKMGEISELSDVIKPDIGVVTNIGVSHLEILGSRENIKKAKLEILDGMNRDGLLVLNKDNDLLKDYKNDSYRVGFCAIEDESAQVFARDISFGLSGTNFEIVDGDFKCSATIPCFGEHNVYSALIAYMVGKEMGMDRESLIRGMASYKPSGMRQKLEVFKGTTFVVDCYNASPDSMGAGVKTLSDLKIDGSKIMVISDMLELGQISKKAHYDIGKLIAESDIDRFYCFGNFAGEYESGAVDAGMERKKIKVFEDKIDLAKALEADIKPLDIVWFKASRGMKLEEIIQKIYNRAEQ